jgi:hypothetical protein
MNYGTGNLHYLQSDEMEGKTQGPKRKMRNVKCDVIQTTQFVDDYGSPRDKRLAVGS